MLLASYDEGMLFNNVKIATEYLNYYEPEDLTLKTSEIELFTDGTVGLGKNLTYMTPAAWRQLLRLAGRDAKLADIDDSELATLIKDINEWFRNNNKELLFRMNSGVVTAALTEVYCPVSNLDILKALAEVGVEKCRIHLRNGWLWASVINEKVAFTPKVGDIIHGGWDLNHNDRGQGALHIAHFLFRLVCLNGAVVTEKGTSVFMHRASEKELLTGAIKDSVSTLTQYTQLIASALEEMIKVELGVKRTLKLLNVAKRLLGKKIFDEFQENVTSKTSCYAAYNYITQLAQNYAMDNRRELEVLGGNLVAEFMRR